MLDPDPVQVTVDGSVVGLPRDRLEARVADGMRTAAPTTCCAGAGQRFRAIAPIDMTAVGVTAPGGDGYRVLWRFQQGGPNAASPATLVARAELWRGTSLLTEATGNAALPTSGSTADTVEALARAVEVRLTPFPDFFGPEPGGGG